MDRELACTISFGFILIFQSSVWGSTGETLQSRLANLLSDDHDYRRDAETLFEECEVGSNRFVQTAKEVYAEHLSARERSRLVSLISKHAEIPDLPFLEGCVTNAMVGLPALTGILRLQGVCSNSIAQIARFNQAVDMQGEDRMLMTQTAFAVVSLFREPVWNMSSCEGKTLAWKFAYSYVSNNVNQAGLIDEAIQRIDPTYKNSKRRLALLRLAQPVVPGPFSPEYVTNAINELVAYPEAELPE